MLESSPAVVEASQRSTSWKWWICGLLLLATMINYMDRLTLTQTSKRVMEELKFGERGYGELESGFAYAFALGAILSGWMADRFNVRWLYPAALVAWSAAGFATGLVQGFVGLLACRFFLGLSEAGHWPCALRTTQRILPPAERSLGNSILQSGAAIGSILTPLLILAMPNEPGSWRLPFMIVGGAGMTWAFLWLASVGAGDVPATATETTRPPLGLLGLLVALLAVKTSIRVLPALGWTLEMLTGIRLLCSVAISAIGIVAVFRWLLGSAGDKAHETQTDFRRRFFVLLVVVFTINTTWHFFRAWMPLFLQNQHDYKESDMNLISMGYYIAADIGSLAAGSLVLLLANRGLPVHGSRVSVFAVCAGLCALGGLAAALLPAGPMLLAMLLIVGFGALGLFPNYYSFTQELSAQHQGKVSGALGCSVWLSMAPVHEAVGEFVQGGGSYSMQMAIAAVLPSFGLAAILLWWGKDRAASH